MALSLASLWLAGLATLGLLLGVLLAVMLPSALGGPEAAIPVCLAAAGLGASAIVAYRASKGRRFAVIAAFVLGVVGSVVLLAPALERILPWTGGLYGISLDGLGYLLGLWALVLPPAVLLVIGSVRRWCAMGGAAAAARRAWIAGAVAVGVAAPVIAIVLVDLAAPRCPPGRTCIPAAGLSLVLPEDWGRRVAGAGGLFEAGMGDERRIVIKDGYRIIGSVASLDEVEREATEQFGGNAIGFDRSGVSSERIDLPIGPAVRVAWQSRPWFYQVDQNNITEWFFLDRRLLVIVYQEMPPGSASEEFRLVRESLRTLRG